MNFFINLWLSLAWISRLGGLVHQIQPPQNRPKNIIRNSARSPVESIWAQLRVETIGHIINGHPLDRN